MSNGENQAAPVAAALPASNEQISPTSSQSEREAFEAWHRSKFATKHCTGQPTRDMHNGIYAEKYGPENQQLMWEAWQAASAEKAALAATPALPAEKVQGLTEDEQTALLCKIEDYMNITDRLSQTHPDSTKVEDEIYAMVNGFIASRLTASGGVPAPKQYIHDSDCSLHNEPAYPAEPCDCSVSAPALPPMPEGIGAILTYVTAGHNKACGQTIGANGAGEFSIIFSGTPEQANTAARDYVRALERAGHKFTSVVLVTNEEGYGGPLIKCIPAAPELPEGNQQPQAMAERDSALHAEPAVNDLPAVRYYQTKEFYDADYVEFAAGEQYGGGVKDGVPHASKHYTRADAEQFTKEGAWRKVEVAKAEQSSTSGAAAGGNTIPNEVRKALDRMCMPLHESRLDGCTAKEDARCMAIIKAHIESAAPSHAASTEPDTATQAVQPTEQELSIAGRALADRSAELCNVDKEDNWKLYGNEYIEDARVVFAAILANQSQKG